MPQLPWPLVTRHAEDVRLIPTRWHVIGASDGLLLELEDDFGSILARCEVQYTSTFDSVEITTRLVKGLLNLLKHRKEGLEQYDSTRAHYACSIADLVEAFPVAELP